MSKLSHLNERGEAHMVDVSQKQTSVRTAVAEGRVMMNDDTLELILSGEAKKGDVLAAARIAGIMAAKRTSELVPLCHPLAWTNVTVDFEVLKDPSRVVVRSMAKVSGQTGVEMEALTSVCVACLTIYDMLKAADKGMQIDGVRLVSKTGGRSGDFQAPEPRS